MARTLPRLARAGLATAACALLAGCGTLDPVLGRSGPPLGSPGFVQGFLGGVSAEEPRAALVGREILAAGGSAADAAVGIGFALGVTLPSRASLAGGGVCLAYDPRRDQGVAATFLPRAPAVIDPGSDRPAALPGTPRGLYALHARLGRLPFERVIAPAEQLARFGTQASRAFVRDLAVVSGPLFADPQARALFGRPDGAPVAEGDLIVQAELGNLIGLLRTQGIGAFHQGALARRLADASRAAGGALAFEELRGTLPALTTTLRTGLGPDVLHAAPVGGSVGAAAALRALMARQEPEQIAPLALAAAAATRAGADPQAILDGAVPAAGTLPPVLGATTGFVAVDREGMAVTCALTNNNLFGTGRIAPGLGLLLAAAPGTGGVPPALPTVTLVSNTALRAFRLAAAASGGEAAPIALAVASREAMQGRIAAEAVAAPRPGAAERLGRVSLIHCPGYLPGVPATCTWAADPRGFGLAVGAD
ncbi:MAG: gamma-glutamyltransferase [Acetobacteraceae bacterium]